MIAEFRRQDPARFAWQQPPYEYEHDKQPIDVLYGSDQLRLTIDRDGDVGALVDRGSQRKRRSASCASPS